MQRNYTPVVSYLMTFFEKLTNEHYLTLINASLGYHYLKPDF